MFLLTGTAFKQNDLLATNLLHSRHTNEKLRAERTEKKKKLRKLISALKVRLYVQTNDTKSAYNRPRFVRVCAVQPCVSILDGRGAHFRPFTPGGRPGASIGTDAIVRASLPPFFFFFLLSPHQPPPLLPPHRSRSKPTFIPNNFDGCFWRPSCARAPATAASYAIHFLFYTRAPFFSYTPHITHR